MGSCRNKVHQREHARRCIRQIQASVICFKREHTAPNWVVFFAICITMKRASIWCERPQYLYEVALVSARITQ
jgi:hypothetical protein